MCTQHNGNHPLFLDARRHTTPPVFDGSNNFLLYRNSMRDAEKPDPIFEKINQDNLMSLRLVGVNSREAFEALETGTPFNQWDRITTLLMHAKELERWLWKYYDAMTEEKIGATSPPETQEFPEATLDKKKILMALILLSSACKEIEQEIRGGSLKETERKILSIFGFIRILRNSLKSYLCDLAKEHPDVAPDHVKKMWLDRA